MILTLMRVSWTNRPRASSVTRGTRALRGPGIAHLPVRKCPLPYPLGPAEGQRVAYLRGRVLSNYLRPA